MSDFASLRLKEPVRENNLTL